MANSNLLSLYFGGVVGFCQDVTVANRAGQEKTYRKGDRVHITPAILHMVATAKIPEKAVKPVLKTLEQMTDEEALELSRIVYPDAQRVQKKMLLSTRKVHRQGKRKGYTVEIEIGRDGIAEKSVVINAGYNVAVSEIVYPPFDGARPAITQLAVPNQTAVFHWLLSRHFDVFNLIDKYKATGMKKWVYETPQTLAQK